MAKKTRGASKGSPRHSSQQLENELWQGKALSQIVDWYYAKHEMYQQSDRGAAIIGGAMVDDALGGYMKSQLFMVRDKGTQRNRDTERLFEPDHPLGSFSAKILASHAMWFISDEMFFDLEDIRWVRNRFAHWPRPQNRRESSVSFDTSGIRIRCMRLVFPERHPPLVAERIHRDFQEGRIQEAEFRRFIESSQDSYDIPPNTPRDRYIHTCCGIARILSFHSMTKTKRPVNLDYWPPGQAQQHTQSTSEQDQVAPKQPPKSRK